MASGTFFQPHLAQGYCQDVVGRFFCLDVKFLCCFKKRVVTKRASLGASSASGVNANSDGEFPDTIQHDGYCPTPTSRSHSTARAKNGGGCSSLSPSCTFERCGSGPYPYSPPQNHNRSTSPLSHSVISSSSSSRSVTKAPNSDQECGGFG